MSSCPKCGEPVAATDAFCENCGTQLGAAPAAPTATEAPAETPAATGDPTPGEPGESARTHFITPPAAALNAEDEAALPPPRTCADCGGTVGEDGYCTTCGVKASNGREHVIADLSPMVAGVCDKGIVHPRNEDSMALAVTDRIVLVVCDGVTTSTDSDVASLAAAEAARDVLAAAPLPDSSSPAARVTHWSDLLKQAAITADLAVERVAAEIGDTHLASPPSCTFVAAVADGDLIVAGWVGDSRAYWLPDAGPAEQLSIDDSWATEQINAGISREVAETGPHAHAITRWLGPDSPDVAANTSTVTVTSPGWLLVCSDGLWNYVSEASALGELVAAQKIAEPLPLAEALIAWANGQGGHDNITATLARLTPAAS